MKTGMILKIEKVGPQAWALTGRIDEWRWPVDEIYSNAMAAIRRRRAIVGLVSMHAQVHTECDTSRDNEVYCHNERGAFVNEEWSDDYDLYLDSDFACETNPSQPCANCIEMAAAQFA